MMVSEIMENPMPGQRGSEELGAEEEEVSEYISIEQRSSLLLLS